MGGGGGGGAKYKKYSRKGKLKEKSHARQMTLKKYSYKGLKKFMRLENSPPFP